MIKEDSIAMGAKAYLNKNEMSDKKLSDTILLALAA
jgi:hypothetical protein